MNVGLNKYLQRTMHASSPVFMVGFMTQRVSSRPDPIYASFIDHDVNVLLVDAAWVLTLLLVWI